MSPTDFPLLSQACEEGDNGGAAERSAKVRLQGQLGMFTQDDESIMLILNHICLLPTGKVCRAQQVPSPPAPGMHPEA